MSFIYFLFFFFLHRAQKEQRWDNLSATFALRRGTYSWASFPLFPSPHNKNWSSHRGWSQGSNGKLRMAYEVTKSREKWRKWATLSCWPQVLASIFPHVCSMVLWPWWCAGCLHRALSKHLWSRNKLPDLKMFITGDRHMHTPGMDPTCSITVVQEFLVTALTYYMGQGSLQTIYFLQTVALHSEDVFHHPLQNVIVSVAMH